MSRYILIADDDVSVGRALSILVRREGLEVRLASTPERVVELVREEAPGVIVMDMNYTGSTTGREGLELLRKVKVLRAEVPVILITAWGSIELAVEGMKFGAADFVTKPWRNDDILRRIRTALALNGEPAHGNNDFDRCGIVGQSRGITEVLETVRRVAPTDASVLILGENGTGKEMIARAIHRNSLRAAGPLVSVNLGAIPHALFESEMFGYVKGAFTDARDSRKGRFEMADKGTIFLDEIGELDQMSQVKMLRVLQERSFEPLGESVSRRADFRLISATNADLTAMVADKSFREDLFYRINLITLRIPALRERREDIEPLTRHFMEMIGAERDMRVPELGRDAIELLEELPYPGNIRELKNRVERAMVIYGGDNRRLEAEHFAHDTALGTGVVRPEATTLDAVERDKIMAVLEAEGNVSRAAKALGLTRQALYRRMAKLGIDRK
ncbi:MAG: sigma-54-dependent Fis family transcriptional regulator [Bacteroides sp.]|nr:sigma-54-dependent Fis family transcriptional regulator [Bacteroides sp.]